MASHIMDALRYVVTAFYQAAGPNPEDEFTSAWQPGDLLGSDRSVIDNDEDDLPPRVGRMLPTMRAYGGLS